MKYDLKKRLGWKIGAKMSTSLAEFSEKFRLRDLTVLRLDHWTWSIRPVHSTLGAGILSLNRLCTSFGSITNDESSELGTAIQQIEGRLRASFRPDKFNYLMLMMVDAHLHFHVFPRYEAPRYYANVQWVDKGWPTLPILGDGVSYERDPILLEIRNTVASAIA